MKTIQILFVSCFTPTGDTVYGRVMMDPTQNLGESFYVNVEKCFLCAGVDGYVPKYDPEKNEYGCVADSEKLLHSFKIIVSFLKKNYVSKTY